MTVEWRARKIATDIIPKRNNNVKSAHGGYNCAARSIGESATLTIPLASIIICCLAGCASQQDIVTRAGIDPSNQECLRVAMERMSDAEAGGYDDDTQEQVLKITYSECAAWHEKESVVIESASEP